MAIITVKDQIEKILLNDTPRMGISTGISDLDRVILGLRPANLITIAGFSGIGKSGFMTDLGLAASKERDVAMFTLEMGAEQTAERLLYNVADLNYHRGVSGNLSKSEKKKLKEASDYINDMPYNIILDDESDMVYPSWTDKPENTNSIGMAVQRYIDEGVSVFIIDYVQLMQYRFQSMSETLRIKEITGRLHKWAVKYNVTFIILAQLKKEVEEKCKNDSSYIPTKSDIRDSGFIINDSDIILMLHRPDFYKKKDSILFDDSVEPAQIYIAKMRNGPSGPIDCLFHSFSMSWRGLETGEI